MLIEPWVGLEVNLGWPINVWNLGFSAEICQRRKMCHWVAHVCPVPGRVEIKKEDCGGILGGTFTAPRVLCTWGAMDRKGIQRLSSVTLWSKFYTKWGIIKGTFKQKNQTWFPFCGLHAWIMHLLTVTQWSSHHHVHKGAGKWGMSYVWISIRVVIWGWGRMLFHQH